MTLDLLPSTTFSPSPLSPPSRFLKLFEFSVDTLLERLEEVRSHYLREVAALESEGVQVVVLQASGRVWAMGLKVDPEIQVPSGYRPHSRWSKGYWVPDRRTALGKRCASVLASLRPTSVQLELRRLGFDLNSCDDHGRPVQVQLYADLARKLVLLELPSDRLTPPCQRLSYEEFYAQISEAKGTEDSSVLEPETLPAPG